MAKQLLAFEGNRLVLVEEGLSVIAKADGPLGILCITGQPGSGRSFLLDKILGLQGYFRPQNTKPASTQGVLIYGQLLSIGPLKVACLDVQGFNGSDQDSALFAVLYLISSTFIFNSKGAIDEAAMLNLSSCLKLTRHIQANAANPDLQQLVHISPKFIWTVRDFQLSLVDEDGNSISAKDYMENIFSIAEYKGRKAEDCNKIRTAVTTIFPERECVVLPRPSDTMVEAVHLQDRELKPNFLSQVDKVKSKCLLACPAKRLFGQKPDGRLMSKLLRLFVDVAGTNRAFDLTRSWKQVVSEEYASLFEEVKLLYNSLRDFNRSLMPYEEPVLITNLHQAKLKALLLLRRASIKDQEQAERLTEDFEAYYATDYRYTLEENYASSMEFNLALLDAAFREIFLNMDKNAYNKHMDRLESDWAKATLTFEERSRGPAKLAALKEFSDKYQHERFSKFFKDMVSSEERKLAEAVRESNHSKEQRMKAEIEARQLAESEETVGTLIRDMEKQVGLKTPEGAPLHQVMNEIVTWLRQKQDERASLERDNKKIEEELAAIEVEMSNKKKSCCSLL